MTDDEDKTVKDLANLVHDMSKACNGYTSITVLMANFIFFSKVSMDILVRHGEKDITQEKIQAIHDGVREKILELLDRHGENFDMALRERAIQESIELAKND